MMYCVADLLGVEGVPALRGVNLHIKQGEFIMILGTSGGGKVIHPPPPLPSSTASHRSAAMDSLLSPLPRCLALCLLRPPFPPQTSLLNIIGTIDKPTKGEITICGQRTPSSTLPLQRQPACR